MSALPAIPTPYIHSSIKRRKNTWYSIADGNWSDRNIWISNSVRRYNYPQDGDDVYVNHNVVGNVTSTVGNLRISGKLTFANSITIRVNGDIQSVGTVDMSGSGSNLFLYGANNYIVTFVGGTSGTVTYARNGEQPIMNLIYRHLSVIGTGIKYPNANLVILGNFSIPNYSVDTVQLSVYNLSVGGYSSINGYLYKSGSGTILFTGQINTFYGTQSAVDLSGGNPTVECRGGINIGTGSGGAAIAINGGSGTWYFTTNNQSLVRTQAAPGQVLLKDIIIDNISLTVLTQSLAITNSCNGTNSNSKLINSGSGVIVLATLNTLMSTGVFDFTSGGQIVYFVDGNFTLPFTNYYHLNLMGTGIKTVSGNLSVQNLDIGTNSYGIAYFINSNSSLQLDTSNLVVYGNATISGYLLKPFAGNILFKGYLKVGNAAGNDGSLNFEGAVVDVECQGYLTYGTNTVNAVIIKGGNGTWSFTVSQSWPAPQIAVAASPATALFKDMRIGAGVEIFVDTNQLRITNSLTGVDSSSKLTLKSNGKSLEYQSTASLMPTGILDTSTNVNQVIYNLNGNQPVRGGTYSKLTLGGGGIKQLQGNIVVTGAFSLEDGATLDLNGYTKT